MKIAYITAGAGGMFCGSCLHDNTLAAALVRQGHDALLIPTYTPIRTDEPDVSQKRVFLGGINVYLQQKLGLFRHTPWFLDRLFDARPLLRWVARFAVKTEASDLGDLTVSILEGEHGHQSKEVDKLVAWLRDEVKPEIVHLTAALLSGLVHELKQRLKVPVLCSLQGDDIFLESLPESHRSRCLALVRVHCREIDGFVATSAYYADFMSEYLSIPRERIHVVYPGLNLTGHGGSRLPLTPNPSPLSTGEGGAYETGFKSIGLKSRTRGYFRSMEGNSDSPERTSFLPSSLAGNSGDFVSPCPNRAASRFCRTVSVKRLPDTSK